MGALAFLSPCHWLFASLQELSFFCNGEFGVGVRDGADDVDDDIGDGIADGFGGIVDSPQKARICRYRGLLAEEPLLYFSLLLLLPYCCCCIVVVIWMLLWRRRLLMIDARRLQ